MAVYGETSYTRLALQVALEGAAEMKAHTHLVDLRDYDLPFCAGKQDDNVAPANVVALRQAIREADGLILGTPEYHGSYSGVLKNALDLMGFTEFGGKMMGLICVSGGRMAGLHALNGLRVVGRSLHAWVIPEQVGIPRAWTLFDDNGRLTDSKLAERLREVGRQVARFSFLHRSEQVREFLREWESAQPNPGG